MNVDISRPSFGFTCWAGHPEPMTVAHQHDDIEFNFSSGAIHYLLGGRRVTVPAGQPVVFWGARPHQLVELGADPLTWVTVPLAAFLSWSLPSAFVAALLQGTLMIPEHDEHALELTARLRRWARDFGSGSDYTVATARIEIEAFARRIAESSVSHSPFEAGPTSSAAVESAATMARYISGHITQPVRVEEVAAAVHLHPSYAMSLFKRVIGVSIGSYVAQCRVAEAQRLLISSTLPVAEIGAMVGFGSQSQFYEQFRATCGVAPAAYRRSYHAAGIMRIPAR